MPTFLAIVAHTPLWVWPLLLLVLGLGWYGRRTRVVPPVRLATLPLVGLGTSAVSLAQSSEPLLTGAGWLVALLVCLPMGHRIGRRRPVRRLDDGRLEIAGGWFLLGFGVSIFAVRYALGVLFGIMPELARRPLWIVIAGAAGGAVAGIGLGWLAGLLAPASAKGLRRVAMGAAALPLLAIAVLAGAIAFDSPAAVPRLAAGDSLPGAAAWDWSKLPPVSRVTARDGASLAYRLYPGRADRAIVLVHGSSGASDSMHHIAQALQRVGATVYAISLRGHGGSGTINGDVSYKGQLDDDLADFVKAVGLDKPGLHRTLVGFSSGGGFVLRTASGANRDLFDAYFAISPYIAQDSPTSRPKAGGWASVAVPRVIALSILDGFGVPLFQGLPVVRMATDAGPSATRTPVYSFRLLASMHLDRSWRREIAGIARPTVVAVGGNDELFMAAEFVPLFQSLNPRIGMTVVPDSGHMDMIARDRAIDAVVALWQGLAGGERAGRFDVKVREDMFAGFDGDTAAFERAMKLIAVTLAADPDHAEALTWRGAGRLFMAGRAFRHGADDKGTTLAAQGVADLDRGVSLMPGSIATHAVRGSALMPYARGLRAFDKAAADRLTLTAISDFEFIAAANAARRKDLASHDRGEVLGALAEGWLQLADGAKAEPYLERLMAELPGTSYAKNAALRRSDPVRAAPLTCLGCH